jgi:hypothetical protein
VTESAGEVHVHGSAGSVSTRGNILHLLAASALSRHVPSVSAMRFASIPPPQMAAALRFGKIERRSSAAVRARWLAVADRTGFPEACSRR